MRAADDCTKDIYFYLDVSGTMQKRGKDGLIPLEAFAGAIHRLIRSNFLNPNDGVHLLVFADRVQLVTSTDPSAEPLMGVDAVTALALLENRKLVGAMLDKAAPKLLLQFTDLREVVKRIQKDLEEDRKQYFIIASDFIHDPDKIYCDGTRDDDPSRLGQIESMRVSLTETIAGLSGTSKPVLILLSPPDPICPGVASRVKDALSSAITTNVVNTRGASTVDAKAIREGLSKPPSVLPRSGVAASAVDLPLMIQNPNPFDITLRSILIRNPANVKEVSEEKIARPIPCGPPHEQIAAGPPWMADKRLVKVETVFDIGSIEIDVPLERFTIGDRRSLYFEKYVLPGTLVVDLSFEQNLMEDKELLVHIGRTTKRFPLRRGSEQRRVILPIDVDDDEVIRETRNGQVYIRFEIAGTEIADRNKEVAPNTTVGVDVNRTFGTRVFRRAIQAMGVFTIVLGLLGEYLAFQSVKRLGIAWRWPIVLLIAYYALVPSIHPSSYLSTPGRWEAFVGVLGAACVGTLAWITIVCFVWPYYWESKALLPLAAAQKHRNIATYTIVSAMIVGGVAAIAFAILLPNAPVILHALN